jgi:PAS domain S-box-containing protein
MGAGAGAMQSAHQAAVEQSYNKPGGSAPAERVVSMRQKKMSHLEKTRLVQTVETFTKLVYLNVPSEVSIANFLQSELGSEVFSRFLEREHADHYVKLYSELEKYKLSGSTPKMEWALAKYKEVFPRSLTSSRSVEPLVDRVSLAQGEIIRELAKNMFPRFLCSGDYQKWRAAERSTYTAMFLRGSVCFENTGDGHTTTSRNRENSDSVGSRDENDSIFSSIDNLEVIKIVNADSWLTTLLARAESLPIGLTLLSARSDRKGYPLVYVNKFYEEQSGYEKTEMLGHRWNFLLGTEIDQKTMQVVYKSVKYAKQIKVFINSPRKNGSSYPSVMCLKPIFDTQGSYSYMLGLHLGVDDESPERVEECMQLVDTLALVLPQVLKHAGGGEAFEND